MSLSPGEVVLWDLFRRVSLKEQLACMVRNPSFFTAFVDGVPESEARRDLTVRDACNVTNRTLLEVATAADELEAEDECFVISLDRFSVISREELRQAKELGGDS